MLPVLVLAGLAVAVLSRRSAWVRDRLPVPATTILAWSAAGVVGLALADVGGGTGRTLLSGAVAVVAGAVAVVVAGWLVGVVRPPLARRRARHAGGPTVARRAVALADRHPGTVRGWGVVQLGVRSVVRSGEVRITGLAAEMTYYALISLVPIATALGASLGYLRPLLGDEQVDEIRTSVVDGLATVFAQQVATDVLAPLVDGLLDERRGGFALGALAVTLYLASRVFRAAVRALDDAYRVESRQSLVTQYLLGFAFTVGALVTLVTVLLLVVVGPLLGGGDALAARLGLGDAFSAAWSVLRWPAVLALGGAFLTLLYRYAPNVVSTWRRCLPGAVVGTLGVLLVSTGFVAYVAVAVPETPGADAGSAAVVQAAAQMLGLVLAGALWIWLSSIAVLLGGVLNAEVDAARPRARRSQTPAPVAA
ncbi:YihY/virulence factor BrkB family protein [Cellulomonas sp. IC4_254]|uniref:YhjD/YihY/BrkB family envelope integrity protein n=1 Tax=Cellulomonas sp. IC4_254 TaxID=2714040 RepID=UPI00141F592D|nr:YihY/virulence factor BrkB family protein [Cellulomonas sp. IC4_254]